LLHCEEANTISYRDTLRRSSTLPFKSLRFQDASSSAETEHRRARAVGWLERAIPKALQWLDKERWHQHFLKRRDVHGKMFGDCNSAREDASALQLKNEPKAFVTRRNCFGEV